jgi:FMN phosphatase YigB (HAD superfamily)
MTGMREVVFLLDVDNTLLDNDRIERDLARHLRHVFGRNAGERYWAIFEDLRGELGYADYLGALQRYRVERAHDPRLLGMSSYIVDYPFATRLYPSSLEVIDHLARWGPAVILSDGDVVFQPRKVERSGLFEAVDGRVLIYLHKEQELDDVERRYPAERYVLVDDKLRILAAVKQAWRARVTTVFVRQGHYARDPRMLSTYPAADLSVARVGDLLRYDLNTLLGRRPRTARRRTSGRGSPHTRPRGRDTHGPT